MGAGGIILTVGVAALVLMLGGLLVYMSQLTRNAYQIKVELQSELETGLRRVDDEADKKLKWLKRDTFEEVDKIRTSLGLEHERRLSELQDTLAKRLQERDELWKRERSELLKILEQQRENIKLLDQRLRELRREQRRTNLATLAEESAPPPAADLAQLPPPSEEPLEQDLPVAQAAPA